ncbi:MAG: sulfate ABC transporter substrate-binding protein, partial [Selenomonadaceae bacterium]|nr:sulfate ABC transporter substrate-binding protein [Selenomonadaceae bacterium]
PPQGCKHSENEQTLLNVSYGATYKLYDAYNLKFKSHWEKDLRNGKVTINQSHDGSGQQVEAVINGVEADVVTLALAYEVIEIKNAGLIRGGWQNEFPDNSSPYTSTIVFLVRKGNPKNISDWEDLLNDDIEIVTGNPKTSGGAQWTYLAAWEYAKRKFDGDENLVKDFMRKIFLNVTEFANSVHNATVRFVNDGKGDVLITWENEALISVHEHPDDYEIITPSLSILAEPTVALVDKVVDKKGTRELATEYLNYLYSDEGQEIAAQNFYRPRSKKILKKYSDIFKPLELFTIDDVFGGWALAYKKHFADGATFDQVTEGINFP